VTSDIEALTEATVPLASSPWRRNEQGGWPRQLPDGSQLAVRSRDRWYWSRCDGTAARYSPAFAGEDEAFGAALESGRD
jgi:hypothetical protein